MVIFAIFANWWSSPMCNSMDPLFLTIKAEVHILSPLKCWHFPTYSRSYPLSLWKLLLIWSFLLSLTLSVFLSWNDLSHNMYSVITHLDTYFTLSPSCYCSISLHLFTVQLPKTGCKCHFHIFYWIGSSINSILAPCPPPSLYSNCFY